METGILEQQAGLRSNRLSFIEIVAQSIGTTAPSVAPFFTIPLIYATVGNATWLVVAFAAIALFFLSRQLNIFTSRIAAAGAMLVYIREAMGPAFGLIASVLFLIGYIIGGCTVVAGFVSLGITELHKFIDFDDNLYIMLALAAFGVLLPAALAWRDVKLSSKVMLAIELITLSLVVITLSVYFIRHGTLIDMPQLTLEGLDFSKIFPGVVLAFFGYIGFESASALGAESREPTKTIPRAIIASISTTAVILITTGYGFTTVYHDGAFNIGEDMPPVHLAEQLGVKLIAGIMSLGIMSAFIACMLAAINATSRMLYQLAAEQLLFPAFAKVHKRNATPHMAILLTSAFYFTLPSILLANNIRPMDAFGYFGTLPTFSILGIYILLTIAAPPYLKKREEFHPREIIFAAITLIMLSVPLIGSIYPVPDYPLNILPYIFIGLTILGSAALISRQRYLSCQC